MSVKILSGDIYQIRDYKRKAVKDFLSKNPDFAYENIDLDSQDLEASQLLSRLSVSMLCPCKLVVLENMSKSEFKDKIELVLQKGQLIDLIVIEPTLDKKTTFGKILSKHPQHHQYLPLTGMQLINWLQQQAQVHQANLVPHLAQYLVERVGEDQLLLSNEIQKLSLYPLITRDLIDRLVPVNYSSQIFDLLNALISGNLRQTLDLYEDQRKQKNQPLNILGSIVWQLEIFLIVKNSQASVDSISQKFTIHRFPLQKSRRLVQHMSLQYLYKLLELCRQTDRRIRHHFIDPDEALLFLITKGCSLKNN